jgi:hypothetical protein
VHRIVGARTSRRACEGHESELAARLALHADPLLADGYAVLYVGPNVVAREAVKATVRAFLRERLAPAQH